MASYQLEDNSPIRFQLFTKNDSFEEDQDAVISGALFSDSQPIAGAQVTVEMSCRRDVSNLLEQVSWAVQSSVLDGDSRVFQTQLRIKSNATGTLNDLGLRMDATAAGYEATPCTLQIGQLVAGAEWISPTISVRQPRGTFLPAFERVYIARGQQESLTLLDSGDNVADAQIGDGLYGVKLKVSSRGSCGFTGKATGLLAGANYVRDGYQEVPVTAVRASLGVITDYSEDTNGDGKPETVGMSVRINVRRAGSYQLFGVLEKGSRWTELSETQTLSTGAQQIVLKISADSLRTEVGELGPFQRRHLRLLLVEGSTTSFMDEQANAGNSEAWQLGGTAFSVKANGAASLSAFPTVKPSTGYTSLNYSIPVRIEKSGLCAYQVVIVTRNGSYSQKIDDAFEVGSVPLLKNIEGSIPGWKIRKEQGGGIFEIKSAEVACGGALNTWTGESQAQAGPHPSAEFELVAPSFDLSFESTDTKRLQISATQTRPQEFFFNVDPIGDFDNTLTCSFDRQPTGITLSFETMPAKVLDWPVKVMVSLSSGVVPGPAPVTVSCTGRGITKSAVLDLNII